MINADYTISKCIARWGHPASIALMDPACQIFTESKVPGIIGYRLEANHVIVFGDPLCDPADVAQIIKDFHDHFESKVKNIIYIAASEAFTQGSLHSRCGAAIGIGHEIILNPSKDPRQETGYRASLLRRNCKKAIRNEVEIFEYIHENTAIEKAIIALGESWVQHREGPQVYLQNVNIFSHREHKRFFYAKVKETIVGVLILNRLDIHDGWVISFSMVAPDAPDGTSELMIVSSMEILGKEHCEFFAIGTVPLPEITKIQGLHPMADWCVRKSYNIALKVFHLEDRERYWQKFSPQVQSSYLLLSKPKIGVSGVMGIMSALNARQK